MVNTCIFQQTLLNKWFQVFMAILLEILDIEQTDEIACYILHIMILML